MASTSTSFSSFTSTESKKIWSRSRSKKNTLKKDNYPPEEKQEYRRKFLNGLQFYCENPSLILNSDLPADLVEFVTSQGFPVEALGVVLELKKASVSGSKSLEGLVHQQGSLNSQKLAELSRKLVEHWMSSDSCSEAFVSLSLGDELPGLIAETTSFHRLLFAIPDCFNLSSTEFLKFLLNQCFLATAALIHGVREEGYSGKVRSQPIATFLDRICLRFHSDSEHFFGGLLSQENNPFVSFIADLQCLCKEDFIARRLVTKILLGLGTNSGVKVAKTVFLVGDRDSCSALHLLHPPEEYFTKSPIWKHIICSSIPLKTPTKSKLFWSNWAHFILTSSPNLPELFETCVSNWGSLCSSSAVDSNILIPVTYALVALSREVKAEDGENSKAIMSEAGKIFETVSKCLDSTSEEKKACGMALGQIMGDFLVIQSPQTEQSGEIKQKLLFQSSNPIFMELIEYYNVGYVSEQPITELVKVMKLDGSWKKKRIEVLDSDDEIDDNEDNVVKDEDEYAYSGELTEFDKFETSHDIPIDQRLLDIRSKGKLPSYFSEIVEVLREVGGQNKNESEVEALKYLCVMRIPVLISVGVRIDSNMAKSLSRLLLDLNGEMTLEVPILFALLEISTLYPFEVFDLASHASFDEEHYTSGHRMILLRRLSEIVQLLSKGKCFSCYSLSLTKNRNELIALCPEFINKYYEAKKRERLCNSCTKKLKVSCTDNPVSEGKGFTSSESETQVNEVLTWREIVDRRLEAKTRYFVTPKRKTFVLVPDEYSSNLVPILWASMANRVISRVNFFMDKEERKIRGAAHDMLLAQVFRVLGRIVLGTGGPTCPHLKNISAQVGDLVRAFVQHNDARVRQSVIALLAIVVSISDGATYVLEAVSGDHNIIESLKTLRERETDPENQSLLDHTLAFLAQALAIDCRLKFNFQSGVPSQLRILPDTL